MKKSGKLIAWKFIFLIQLVASCCLVVFAYRMDVIPQRYLIIVGVVLALALVGLGFMMKPRKANKDLKHARKSSGIVQAIGKIISLLLSIILLIGSAYCTKTTKSIKKVAGNTTTVTTFNLYVMKNDNYSKLSDLKGENIGFVPSVSTDAYTQASSKLNEAISYNAKNYKTTDAAVNALYNSKVEGVFLSNAYGTVVKRRHPNFSKETKVLWSITITTSDQLTGSDKNLTKEPFLLYIAGVDSRHSITEASRADVDMLITVNPNTHQILLTSIPRDSFVPLANTNYQYSDKLTHACLFGTTNSVKTINHFMNVNIDYYARVGFKMITKLVDAVGGVRIYSDKAFIPWTNHSVRIKKGWQTMDGKTALAFARERKTYEEGDRHRGANQQAVVKALIKKITSSTSILTNYDEIIDAIAGSFQTNITANQLKALVKYQLDKMPSWQLQSSVLNGTSEKRTGGYMMPNTALYYMILSDASIKQNRQYIVDMLAGKKITVATDQTLITETSDGQTSVTSESTSDSSSSSSGTSSSSSSSSSSSGTTSSSTTSSGSSTTSTSRVTTRRTYSRYRTRRYR